MQSKATSHHLGQGASLIEANPVSSAISAIAASREDRGRSRKVPPDLLAQVIALQCRLRRLIAFRKVDKIREEVRAEREFQQALMRGDTLDVEGEVFSELDATLSALSDASEALRKAAGESPPEGRG